MNIGTTPRLPPLDEHLGRYIGEFTRIFKTAGCKHEAHDRCRPVLEDIAADREFITRVLRYYLLTPGVLNAKNYPVVGIDIALNPDYHLVANCWIPLPGRETNISSKAIHHHGNMLLTTVTLFGPGYEHWLFSKPAALDEARALYAMEVADRRRHTLHHQVFVDAWTPHLPVYPNRLTITLCLWSNQLPTTWKDHVKRVPFLKRNEAVLKRWAARAGLSQSLGLKVVKWFDFYPTEEGFQGMEQRVEYDLGPNEDHLHSVFHTLQETQNDGLAPLVEQQLASGAACANLHAVNTLVRDLRSGRRIEGRLSACHLNVPHATFTTEVIERAIRASTSRMSRQDASGVGPSGHQLADTGAGHGR